MRIGLMVGLEAASLDEIVDHVGNMATEGFQSAWFPNIFALDALTAVAVVGREVPDIELGTAVVPTYPRHPMAMAQQALSAQAAAGGRLALGIGLSHKIVIENMFGLSFDKPARHMREYLSIMLPLVREGSVAFTGETLSAQGAVGVPGATPFPVLLAALAPRMLELAGAVADGTITWMGGLKAISEHITPSIMAAATAAGRPAPRIVVGLPVCVTDDPDGARANAARVFAIYGSLPSYRAMLDHTGVEGPGDVAVVGDEKQVAAQLEAFGGAGATDLLAALYGSPEEIIRSRALLQELAAVAALS